MEPIKGKNSLEEFGRTIKLVEVGGVEQKQHRRGSHQSPAAPGDQDTFYKYGKLAVKVVPSPR